MLARRDPQVNILRATIAAFAAALGGADAITVLPFTAALGLPDRFARRIARNTQLVLLEESHLAKVADPAAGSGSVEDLTDQLCRTAWALFREIEAAGGIAAALANGLVQQKVADVRAKRAAAVARRKDALTGVSIFPNLARSRSQGRCADAGAAAVVRRARSDPAGGAVRGFARRLRPHARGDRRAAEDLSWPLSAPGRVHARAPPSRRISSRPAASRRSAARRFEPAALAAAFKASGATLACLCSSDKVYEKEAVAAAQALKAAGARHIYLAGRPREQEAALRAAGVQSFIYEGCDALATLRNVYDILGVEIG